MHGLREAVGSTRSSRLRRRVPGAYPNLGHYPSVGDLDGSLHSGVLPRARPGHWAGESGRLFDRAIPYRDATPDLLLGVPAATCQEGGFPVVDADAAHVDRGVVAHATLGYGYTPKQRLGHALDER